MTNAINFCGKTFATSYDVLKDVLTYAFQGNDETQNIIDWSEANHMPFLSYLANMTMKQDLTDLISEMDDRLVLDLAKEVCPWNVAEFNIKTLAKMVAFDIADHTEHYFDYIEIA